MDIFKRLRPAWWAHRMDLLLRRFFCLIFGLYGLLGCGSASAQFSKLDELTAQVAKKLKAQKPHLIGVSEFTTVDGFPSNQGDYFAWFVSTSLVYHGKQLPIAERDLFKALLAKEGIAPKDLSSTDALKRVAASTHIDTLITGTVETGPANYTIRVIAWRLPEASPLIDKTTVIKRTGFTDSLSETFPPKTDYPLVRVKKLNGVIDKTYIPRCIYCPNPDYNDAARRSKIQGTSMFEVLISPAGDVMKAHPTKLLGYGLDEQAYEAIKRWRLKPVTQADGTPVAVLVEVEVTFHLY